MSASQPVPSRVSAPSPAAIAPVLKPLLRGWLHAGAAPLVLAAGIVLVCVAAQRSGAATTTAVAVYAGASTLLFATSAVYHRFRWSDRARLWLMRADHGNIPLVIAGSMTPVALLGLTGGWRVGVLATVWTAALLAVAFRWLWPRCPRALHTSISLVLGWALLPALPVLLSHGGVAVFTLVLVGGALYTVGGVVYGLKRPNPWPRTFGFHEVFHALTLLAWPAHYVAISLLAYR
ncbi:PAQR family membrane homeostasis protein TrhA [Quadrisphaera oryzae]|uniref:PAQR family membrane homeostasis protein TrhA n=1 Tax=Quadrisphaera TaxID=317661 RepID=UPI001644CDE1|nr:hemolysin III family protein [Quadrisphaera sp. RL12-1S]MBC3760377.1 hemolysin III family protein [Quadrisphaera sp. RL12-1S]